MYINKISNGILTLHPTAIEGSSLKAKREVLRLCEAITQRINSVKAPDEAVEKQQERKMTFLF